jgi:cell division protein FtsN
VSAPATAQPARAPASVAPAKNIAKNVEAPKETPRVLTATKPTAAKAATTPTAAGPYWVQVGAFKDPETAKRLVAQLREQGFRAEQSTTSKVRGAPSPAADSPSDRYSVIVSGGAPGELDAKLAAKGMTTETTPGGLAVRPSLPLRDAVALSRELADAGLTVQVRRQGAAVTSAPARTGETWYRVRVGGFPDRGAAVASLKKLEEKGFTPFIATGNE